MYDPAAGRFLSRDPIRDGRNRYAYCGNDPVNAADPTGLFDLGKIISETIRHIKVNADGTISFTEGSKNGNASGQVTLGVPKGLGGNGLGLLGSGAYDDGHVGISAQGGWQDGGGFSLGLGGRVGGLTGAISGLLGGGTTVTIGGGGRIGSGRLEGSIIINGGKFGGLGLGYGGTFRS